MVVRDQLLRPGDGTSRAVEVRPLALWHLDGGTWARRPMAPRSFVLDPGGERPLADLVGTGLGAGNYFVTYVAGGFLECQAIAIGATCNDLLIEVASGEVPMCVAGRGALAVPDPVRLQPGCEHGGYIDRDEPASGDGRARMLLEDGRVAVELDLRGGRAHGRRVTHLLHDGTPHHVEAEMADGVEHGVTRYLDATGRVRTEIHHAHGRRHGPMRTFDATGALVEDWTWRDGRLYEVRILDAAGRLIAHEHYPDGRVSGTFCRPDRHCSQY